MSHDPILLEDEANGVVKVASNGYLQPWNADDITAHAIWAVVWPAAIRRFKTPAGVARASRISRGGLHHIVGGLNPPSLKIAMQIATAAELKLKIIITPNGDGTSSIVVNLESP